MDQVLTSNPPAAAVSQIGLECHQLPNVFIAHPSDLLTDHVANGDGLVAHGFIHELAARGYRLHIAARNVDLRSPLPANVTLYPVPRRFGNLALDRLSYMLAIRRLLRQLRKTEQIDLVHQLNPVFAGLSLGLVGCGLPVVLGPFVARWPCAEPGRVEAAWFRRLGSAAGRWLINFVQQFHASALLAATPAALDRLSMPRLLRGKTHFVHLGIDETLFCPGPGPGPQDPPSILFYAHLDRRKGIFVLLDAFKQIAEEMPSARLVLVGSGEDSAEVHRWIAASGLAERITLLGRVPRNQAPALMRANHVYCLPSFGEPYGMTAVEAMACGRPVVGTSSGGLGDLISDKGGLRVPPGDAPALARALLTILRSPELQARMGKANRAFIEQNCTWPMLVDRVAGVYRSVLARR